MKRANAFITILLITGCTNHHSDDMYWCSYETDPKAYENCLEVGKDLDEHTAESAGKKVNGAP